MLFARKTLGALFDASNYHGELICCITLTQQQALSTVLDGNPYNVPRHLLLSRVLHLRVRLRVVDDHHRLLPKALEMEGIIRAEIHPIQEQLTLVLTFPSAFGVSQAAQFRYRRASSHQPHTPYENYPSHPPIISPIHLHPRSLS